MSVSLHASITTEPTTLDQHGHVIFKGIGRNFSFSDEKSVLSIGRSPGDGQAPVEINITNSQSIPGIGKEVKSETIKGLKNISVLEQEVRFCTHYRHPSL